MIQTQQNDNYLIQKLFETAGFTKEKIEEQFDKNLREITRPKVLFIDLEQLKEIVPFERDFLEKNILNDPRVRQHQRQRGPHSKRIWLYEPTIRAIEQIIMNEWT